MRVEIKGDMPRCLLCGSPQYSNRIEPLSAEAEAERQAQIAQYVERQAVIVKLIDGCYEGLTAFARREERYRPYEEAMHVTTALRNLLEIKRLIE